ncbi:MULTISPECIES: helix-turn-helix domain-containing protein [Actinomadura]|uniref:Transposase n=1 Tax=Actinomadura yumaensis TaxID=111807 RepID=A0ABW2CMF6_9ACTN
MRLQAAGMFEQGATNAQVAEFFGVTPMTAWRWRQAWQTSGRQALLSQGPGGFPCRLAKAERRLLEELLEAGPPAHGYGDQDWTLARIAEVIDE